MGPRIEKKLVFKYKKIVNPKTNQIVEYPVAHVLLQNENEGFETAMIIDSGSDITFISEDVAKILKLKLGKEDVANVMGGGVIKTKSSKVKITFLGGRYGQVSLGVIPVEIGVGIKEADEDLGLILGRDKIFDLFRITFEQYLKKVTFEKIDPNWHAY